MTIEQYLSDKHCIKIESEKATALVVVHLDFFSYETFFDFIFDSGWKVTVLDIGVYSKAVKTQPKFGDKSDEAKRFHQKTKTPICLFFDNDSYMYALDFFLL